MTATYAPRDWSSQPPYLTPDYKSSVLRAPTKALVPIRQSLSEITGPVYGHDSLHLHDADLTRNAVKNAEPIGERIVVTGRVIDEDGRPQPNMLVEIWQANSAGRYVHVSDQHAAPLDPNFLGGGRCVTDSDGRYRFYTIKPGAYPWGNHDNAWRPAHIHFSLFGPSLVTRLVTQMYFPGDPLLAYDPICQGVPAESRELLVSRFMFEHTEPLFALGYEFDFVLRGRRQTPTESPAE
jgi:protocatechuate 3,4-dioxygenase, beta subunit